MPTVVTWIYFILLNGAPAALQQSAYALGKTIQFTMPAIWVFLIQREPQQINRPTVRSLAIGAIFGLVVAAAMAVLYFCILKPSGLLTEAIAVIRAKVQSFGVSSPPMFLLLALFYSAIHSLLEEYYWRWFVFGQLSRLCRLPSAIVISSFGFAAHHVLVLQHYFYGPLLPLALLLTLCIIVGGAFWAWLYRASNSLVAPWLSHAVIDAAIFAIGYSMLSG